MILIHLRSMAVGVGPVGLFSEISISMSKSEFRFRFWFRLLIFDEIEIPTQFHTDFTEISMSKSEFWFRFRNRNSDFGIGISIPTSEFRDRYKITIQMSKFQRNFHQNKLKILFRLLTGISTSTVEIEIEILITFGNFDSNFVKSRHWFRSEFRSKFRRN
jgi:hypothetical protein